MKDMRLNATAGLERQALVTTALSGTPIPQSSGEQVCTNGQWLLSMTIRIELQHYDRKRQHCLTISRPIQHAISGSDEGTKSLSSTSNAALRVAFRPHPESKMPEYRQHAIIDLTEDQALTRHDELEECPTD